MEVRISEEKEFLNIDLKGSFSYYQLIQIIKDLTSYEIDKVMIDGSDLTGVGMNYNERYALALTGTSFMRKDTRYVIVWPKKELNYLAISLLKLNGINIRGFTKVELALNWLLNSNKFLDLESLEL